jgi:hypothetical protein
MKYIEELGDVIHRLHGAEATHIESVPVRETFKGQTVWEGIVEVFESSRPSRSAQGLRIGARN